MAFRGSNQIESLVAERADAQEMINQWLESWTHESQILALALFYRKQTRYGVGYAVILGSPSIFTGYLLLLRLRGEATLLPRAH